MAASELARMDLDIRGIDALDPSHLSIQSDDAECR